MESKHLIDRIFEGSDIPPVAMMAAHTMRKIRHQKRPRRLRPEIRFAQEAVETDDKGIEKENQNCVLVHNAKII